MFLKSCPASLVFPVSRYSFLVVLLFLLNGCVPIAESSRLPPPGSSYDQFALTPELLPAKEYLSKGQYHQAGEICDSVLPHYSSKYGAESLEVANVLFLKGRVLWQLGNYPEAERVYLKSLQIVQQELGETAAIAIGNHHNLGLLYNDMGKLAEAERELNKALAIHRARNDSGIAVAVTWDYLGLVYLNQARLSKAENAHKKALELKRRVKASQRTIAYSLHNLGKVYVSQDRFSEAEKVLTSSVEMLTAEVGENHPLVASILDSLGEVYAQTGAYQKSEQVLKKSLAIRKTLFGVHHPAVGESSNSLGMVYLIQGKYPDAENCFKKAIDIVTRNYGNDFFAVGVIMARLSNVYVEQGKYDKALTILDSALSKNEKNLGPAHPATVATLNNLGQVYLLQGYHGKAERILKKALQIGVKRVEDFSSLLGGIWGNLGNVYVMQGRYDEAADALKKAIDSFRERLGEKNQLLADSYNNYGILQQYQGRMQRAEEAYRQAIKISRALHGDDSLFTATTLANLGSLYEQQGRFEEAGSLYWNSLKIKEKKLGADHPETAFLYRLNAGIAERKGDLERAAYFLAGAVTVFEETVPVLHPMAVRSLTDYARVLTKRNKPQELEKALFYSRQAVSSLEEKMRIEVESSDILKRKNDGFRARHVLATHLYILSKAEHNQMLSPAASMAESFVIAQKMQNNSVARAISKMTARIADGHGHLGKLAAAELGLEKEEKALGKQLMKAIYDEDERKSEILGQTLHECRDKRKSVAMQLKNEFPEYVELTNPKPVSLADIKALLQKDEALVLVVAEDEKTFTWVVRRDRAVWNVLDLSELELEKVVKKLRAGLDPEAITAKGLPDFDTEEAARLYRLLIEPSVASLDGAEHLFIVTDGALLSIPFSIMVKENDKTHAHQSYREANWLGKEYAFSYLPSVSSFKALRELGAKKRGIVPFVGFGDPVLGNQNGELRVDTVYDKKGSGRANLRGIRRLAALPETAEELRQMAQILGAPAEAVNLRGAAREIRLKQMDLSVADVIAFATHGLISGDFEFLGEPALVLTPPDRVTEEDDGLLTAGEISMLNLNAEWVVLSACNTAASDGSPGGEGFSGLAKAFFYAGARSLLVSHWPVESNVAMKMTTSLFRNLKRQPEIDKAEALRQTKIALIENEIETDYAHPLFWAPFVVVGDASE